MKEKEPQWVARGRKLAAWVTEHRAQILATSLVLLPVVSRYMPAFPTAEVVAVLNAVLGA